MADFINVYFMNIDSLAQSNKRFGELLASLPATRIEKALSYRKEADRHLSAAASYLLVRALAELGIDACAVAYGEREGGKPFILHHNEIDFSLSHSNDTAMCAISSNSVGCDIQCIDRRRADKAVRFFTRREQLFIAEAAAPESEFTRIWTLKESYVKATGVGFSGCPFNTFEVLDENGKATSPNPSYIYHELVSPNGSPSAVCAAAKNTPPRIKVISF